MSPLTISSKIIKALVLSSRLEVCNKVLVFVLRKPLKKSVQIVTPQIEFELNLVQSTITALNLLNLIFPI